MTSSPFLLNAVIHKYVEKYEFDAEFIQKVLVPFYVNNFSGGANTIEETFELLKKLKPCFLESSFNLQIWRTSHSNLPEQIGIETSKTLKPRKILAIFLNLNSKKFLN